MYTSDAELIALVGHGNSFLSGSANSNALNLWQSKGRRSRVMFHGSEGVHETSDWFQSLRRAGVKRLWYVTFAWSPQDLPKRHPVISVGAGVRAIQVDYPAGYELWYSPSHNCLSNIKIWQVAYKTLSSQSPQAMMLDVDATRLYLRQKLEAAAEWEEKELQERSHWASQFRVAAKLLDDYIPQSPFYADLLPQDGYTLSARQLLMAAAQSNIFGGMMSWNDLGWFDDKSVQAKYEQVKHELFDAVYAGFIAAVNSFDEKLVIHEK